jgi:acetyl-CoA acetyltransferase
VPGELSGKAAIAGIGATDFSKNSGRSELRLAAEAVLDALDDAGLTPGDVDGMVTFTMDSNTEVAIARATGIGDLKFFSKIHHGGGAACATVQQAAIAVATGVADCVVAYRAFNTCRSGSDDRQALHAPVGCNQSGLRRNLGRRSQARREQSQGLLLREADND